MLQLELQSDPPEDVSLVHEHVNDLQAGLLPGRITS
jgi:hypothetical protein